MTSNSPESPPSRSRLQVPAKNEPPPQLPITEYEPQLPTTGNGPKTPLPSVRYCYSQLIIEKYHHAMQPLYGITPPPLPSNLEPPKVATSGAGEARPPTGSSQTQTLKVGIIGAGAAGLYCGMILKGLRVDFEILESRDEVGGRLMTRRVGNNPRTNDYYDIGAMRFPNTPVMWRVFDLFRRINLAGGYISRQDALRELYDIEDPIAREQRRAELEQEDHPNLAGQPDDVILYHFSNANDLRCYNGISALATQQDDPQGDHWNVSIQNGGTVPNSYAAKGVDYWLNAKIGYFKERLKDGIQNGNLKQALQELMRYDHNSTRQFMREVHPELRDDFRRYMRRHYPNDPYEHEMPYPDEVVNWIETWSFGTSMYDSAFTETVMEEVDFRFARDDRNAWKCIQGGADRIAQAMATQLGADRIRYGSRVTKVAPVDMEGEERMRVFVKGKEEALRYDHVISTIPLGALRVVNLDECNISTQLRESLRSLQYAASVKVAIRFRHRWWEEQQYGNHRGGVSTTDRISRMIVYPSYGIGDNENGATMLVSYSWSQDATRLATLVQANHAALIDHILEDLVAVHAGTGLSVQNLQEWMVDSHAYDWHGNDNAFGAFAFFGPGQFGPLYQEVTQSAANMHLHFAGEATSTTHAWVVGALDSALRAVWQMLLEQGCHELLQRMVEEWGQPLEMTDRQAALQVVLNQDAGQAYNNQHGAH